MRDKSGVNPLLLFVRQLPGKYNQSSAAHKGLGQEHMLRDGE